MVGQTTLLAFLVALLIGFIISYFVRSPSLEQSIEKPNTQGTLKQLKKLSEIKVMFY